MTINLFNFCHHYSLDVQKLMVMISSEGREGAFSVGTYLAQIHIPYC